MKVLAFSLLLLLPCCGPVKPPGEVTAESPATEVPSAPRPLQDVVDELNELGANCEIDESGRAHVNINEPVKRCIKLINELPAVGCLFVNHDRRAITLEEFRALKPRPETTRFFTLYGTLSREAFSELGTRFPNLEDLTLWGQDDSDLTALPALPKLTFLRIDPVQIVTVEEAKRLALSTNLEEVMIDRASSKEVFDILRKLPNLKELWVTVTDAEGNETDYGFPSDEK